MPFAKVNALDEVADDHQVRYRGSISEMEHESGGTVRLPKSVICRQCWGNIPTKYSLSSAVPVTT